MRGAEAKARLDAEANIALAHTIASFTRAKKLEPLARYLRRSNRGKAKGTMLDRLKAIAERTARR